MGKVQPLRVLILGQQDNFERVLATNIQCWGYEVVTLPDVTALCREVDETANEILLCDLDEPLQAMAIGNESSARVQGLPVVDFFKQHGEQHLRNRLIIVLSSRSVSRITLEQMGAVALLQKPFQIGRLQRYLKVLRRLVESQASEEAQPLQTAGENVRVLVVDDDEDVAHAISQCLLYEEGYEVVVAHEGLDALERCAEWHPQCIVTDLIMPWMNGYQVMRCLALTSLRRMPAFVIMSALTQREVLINPLKGTGRSAVYIEKPFTIDHLLAAIKQVCAQ